MKASQRTGVRLSSFALVLAGTFATAYALGERLPGHNHSPSVVTHGHSADGNGNGNDNGNDNGNGNDNDNDNDSAAPMVPGFEMNGFQLVTEQIGGGGATFHMRGSDGETVTDLAMAHGALLHAVLIRPDLSGFQHVHPTIEGDGSWTVAIDEPGQWHLVFESTPVADGTPVTQSIVVTANVDDETAVDVVPLPPADDTVEVDGLSVSRDGFVFTVTNTDGSATTNLEPYLEQVAHLVVIRQGDLAFKHLHPSDSPPATLDFGSGVSEPGTYRLFLQFGHAGSVVTASFTVVLP